MQTSATSTSDYETALAEKDALIHQLTEHLERAAEQLAAPNKPEKPATGGGIAFEPEMVATQQELSERLQIVIDEWQTLDAARNVQRIETELQDFRELVAAHFDRTRGTQTAGDDDFGQSGFAGAMLSDENDDVGSDTAVARWEALKAQMLGEEPPPVPQGEAPVEKVNLREELEVLETRPHRPSVETATVDDFRDAVDSREKYIISLIRTLRVMHSRRRGQVDWRSLEQAPEELRTRLGERDDELQQRLRQAEVELSIERARLSRQESMLQQREQELEKTLHRRDRTPAQNPREAAPENRRWLKFLGRGGDDS